MVFTPKSEWKEEDKALMLRVYLPGFTEKQISYKIEKRWRYIKVNGDPKTVYFDVSFHQIPEKYNLESGRRKKNRPQQAKPRHLLLKKLQKRKEAEPQKVEDKAPKENEGWNIWMLVSVIIAIGTCIVYKLVVESSRKQN
ncbi:hypothetical protein Tsubulata_028747 [Turnera subulata]|uniref:SHSP domain-containing protein n=1 Tax=Turnera subulata TaxID=218843 RepID=A0A9Q0FP68_9ROSI|nr:hypothetical protein Tsubulata_028747 [Turnera subulata]